MEVDLMTVELTSSQFKRISEMVYRLSGINLPAGKEGLVKTRLTKRLRALGLSRFTQYIDYVERDATGAELTTMLDLLTTNKTSFFRESAHFDFLRAQLPLMRQARGGQLRIWSAGCSSGEEPYTLAIVLMETWPDSARMDVRILATDISTRILSRAREAIYAPDQLTEMPAGAARKYFRPVDADSARLQVNPEVRALVRFAHLNLMDAWPMKGPFDAIFCRNVMIYFDKPTQRALVQRYWDLLEPGGYLFVGHSESLTATGSSFRYVQPAVYVK